ncbi:MAG: O-antigen ligase family protein [Oscillospiraceae bacterium]|jgi:O-antigen ligase|nr:O-antigen ligase family protein [Oscillospiraceae bacterium]
MAAQPAARKFSPETLTRVFVLIIFAVHPLVIGPKKYENITTVKLVFFAAVLCVFAAAIALSAFVNRSKIRRTFRERVSGLRAAEYAAAAFWLVLLLALLFSDDRKSALLGNSSRNEGLLMWTAYLAVFIIAERFYVPRREDLLVFCSVASIVALYGYSQYYGNDFLRILPDSYTYLIAQRLTHVATMSNVDVYSTYLCLAFGIAFVNFVQAKEGSKSAGFFFCGLITLYALVLHEVLSGYVGIFIALAVLLPFIAKDRQSAGRALFMLSFVPLSVALKWQSLTTVASWGLPRAELDVLLEYLLPFIKTVRPLIPYLLVLSVLMLAASAVLLIRRIPLPALSAKAWRIIWYSVAGSVTISGLALLPMVAEITGSSQLGDVAALLHGEVRDTLGTRRGMLWKRSFEMWRNRPILGYGPDQWGAEHMARWGIFHNEGRSAIFDKAHNEYIQVLVDAGVLGLTALLALYAAILRESSKHMREPFRLSVMFAVICFMVQAFFNFSTPFAHPIAWVFLGLAAAKRTTDDVG